MKILAIDTSSIVAGVSIIDDIKVIAEVNFNYKQNHSSTIMPIIDYVTKMTDTNIFDFDYISCCSGPGSFTGLRIGASIAKALALALNKKIIPVPTLDMLAYNIYTEKKTIVPIIDAKCEKVFSAFFNWENNSFNKTSEYLSTTIYELLDKISKEKIDPIFVGDGSIFYKNIITSYNKNYSFAPINLNMQKSSSLGALAFKYYNNSVLPNELVINYFRKSQAEQQLEKQLIKEE